MVATTNPCDQAGHVLSQPCPQWSPCSSVSPFALRFRFGGNGVLVSVDLGGVSYPCTAQPERESAVVSAAAVSSPDSVQGGVPR